MCILMENKEISRHLNKTANIEHIMANDSKLKLSDKLEYSYYLHSTISYIRDSYIIYFTQQNIYCTQ